MKSSFLFITILFVLGLTKSYSGWYHCYNYKGTIGTHPITLSIQITEGYFGAKDKKALNLNGVYKYDTYNKPIKLEGILEDNSVHLFENYDDKESTTLEFEFSENISRGYWINQKNEKSLPLILTYVSKLIDTNKNEAFESVEILQLYTLEDYYFIGVYSKKKDDRRAHMEKLKIINKEDNSVFQIVNFNELDYGVGNLKTIIYQNIEASELSNKKLDVWCDVGKMGAWFTLSFNKRKNKFVSRDKLNIDGPK